MSRYRSPTPPPSPYITPQGHARLKRELRKLWRETRPEVTRALAAAAAEGDRSENAEYTYRKKQLGGIDRRIRYLTKRLDVLKVVDQVPADPSRVFFGAWVELEERGEVRSIRLVGPDEADPASGAVSVDAPLAKALLGKAPGAAVRVELPERVAEVRLVSVRYA